MRGERRQRVVKKTVEAKASINGQHGESDETVTTTAKRVADNTDGENGQPCNVDARARQPVGQIWIVGDVLGVVHEVHEAGRAIQEQQPGQRPLSE